MNQGHNNDNVNKKNIMDNTQNSTEQQILELQNQIRMINDGKIIYSTTNNNEVQELNRDD